MSRDAAAQVQAQRLLRGAWSWQKCTGGLVETSQRKGDLDGDHEKTTENLLQPRRLIKVARNWPRKQECKYLLCEVH